MNCLPKLSGLPPSVSASAGTTLPAEDASGFAKPFVHDEGHLRSLHFTEAELQSRTNLWHPWRLEVDYTRTMMGFLLLHSEPVHIGMIGLGGGSLAKFCHHELPNCRISVAENNPHVLALRREFAVPSDSARFEVLKADGAAFVAARNASFDVLLVDGFDHQGQPASLCTQAFYDDCHTALRPGGVLVVNLHQDDADYLLWVERLLRSCSGNAVEVPAPEKSNCIVFASRDSVLLPRRVNLKQSLAAVGEAARLQLRAEFARINWYLKNPTDSG